ncbi:pyridoxal phosphate-dependent aminotransferase [Leptospira gomenensis]|uniref:Aminotransferase n=1 Tax=Leptospira gomenensis TaxID=2484974 RepID=A0A5F1YDA5_9LEPT|nr:pyridoxal phosphate-dependent aminotransferase [Leptospira gomenensis]TGK35182.1 pyridoxal phosphate-dependent aminotransferase [Leptospira gomenensis]TGK35888.1 pyridoxal phosphate-dependent aminotransferase [Leptospira gomenensis]TGK41043.1 pyridoxal phosphate-dependent aminotransferase [Leptospira gomenensis]TGK61273.1 pyridoxal phosphate-dependent aminotransferase [Leptospira gomenensis]
MEPREFYIEDRLERYRTNAPCNLGESGIRNLNYGELLRRLEILPEEWNDISLEDSPNRGGAKLREEIAKLYPGIGPEEVLITTGTGEALYILFRLLCEPGSSVSYFYPAFQALYEIPKLCGADLHPVSVLSSFLERKTSFLSSNLIGELFREGKDLAIINHPHNPTGLSLDVNAAEAIQRESIRHSGWILFDEHYRFLDYHNELSWTGAGVNSKSVATGSITKCFGVMGLRIGWMIGPASLIEKARSFKDYLTHTVSPISEFLTLKILQKRKELSERILDDLVCNIQYFESIWKELPGLKDFVSPGGGVVSFIPLKKGINSSEYADLLMNQCGVFVLPGRDFEAEGWIRIGFGETPERFREGIDRWKRLRW